MLNIEILRVCFYLPGVNLESDSRLVPKYGKLPSAGYLNALSAKRAGVSKPQARLQSRRSDGCRD